MIGWFVCFLLNFLVYFVSREMRRQLLNELVV